MGEEREDKYSQTQNSIFMYSIINGHKHTHIQIYTHATYTNIHILYKYIHTLHTQTHTVLHTEIRDILVHSHPYTDVHTVSHRHRSDERGNPLPILQGLIFPVNNKRYFVFTVRQTR